VRWLADMLDRARPMFEEGGRLALLRPVFDATESIFFAHREPTTVSPHARDAMDLKRYMSIVIVAVFPCLVAGVYFFGPRVLAMAAVSYACGGAVEVVFACVRKEPISEGFLVTGLLFPLILPPTTPFWMVAVGVVFGVLVGKEVFGGTGHNLFNPALVGRCFLALAYPATMTTGWLAPGTGLTGNAVRYLHGGSVDALSAATPLVLAKQGTLVPLGDLFWGTVSGSVGETSAAVILAGGAFLLLTRVGNWRAPAAVLGSFALGGVLLRGLFPEQFGAVGFHLLAGGLLFGAFFMATDPVTSPITNPGKWIYGCIVGLSALLIRNLTGYVEGVMFAILLGNIFAPLIDQVVFQARIRRLRLGQRA